MLGFESCPWKHEDLPAYHLMNTLIGNSNQGKNRAYNMTRDSPFVDEVQSFNNNFSDSGLFGITVEGAGSHS